MLSWRAMTDLCMKPKLRALDIKRVRQGGREYLHLRDPMALSGEELLAPVQLIPLLALSDGQRDLASIRNCGYAASRAFGYTGAGRMRSLGGWTRHYCWRGSRFEEARGRVLGEYRKLPSQDSGLGGAELSGGPGGIGDGLLDRIYGRWWGKGWIPGRGPG